MSGDGSIYRRDPKTWVAQLSIGNRSNRRYVRRNAPTRAAARAALDELKDEHRAGVKRSQLTTGDYLARWVADVRNIRPNTRRGYAADIAYHITPAIGDIRLFDLAPRDVEGMLTRLAPTVAPKTLRNIHATLRRALTMAARQGLVTRNVAAKDYVDTPKVPDREPDAFTAADVGKILATVAGTRHEALFTMAIGTGLRQGELLGLAWEDIDLAAGKVHVRLALVRRRGEAVREEPKTARSRRSVPLSPAVVEALERHRSRLIAEGFTPVATGPVFVNLRGAALSDSWLSHHAKRVYREADVPLYDFKALRATFSSRLSEQGIPDAEIAKLMGHTRTHTTRKHYIAVTEQHGTAVDVIDALLRESPRESRATQSEATRPDDGPVLEGESGSGGRIRTYDQAVNSRPRKATA